MKMCTINDVCELVVMVYRFMVWLALVHPICLSQSIPMHLHLPLSTSESVRIGACLST